MYIYLQHVAAYRFKLDLLTRPSGDTSQDGGWVLDISENVLSVYRGSDGSPTVETRLEARFYVNLILRSL